MFLDLDPPIVNASGILSFLDVFQLLDRKGAAIGGYITKSISPGERLGNENPVVVECGPDAHPTLNSLALPSQTPEEWLEELKEARLTRSKLIVSVNGVSPEGVTRIVRMAEPYAEGFELNLSCPNLVPGEESVMAVVGRHPEAAARVVRAAREATGKPVIAKLSPDTEYLAVGRACVEAGADYLGCANTMPGMSIDIHSRRPVLAGRTGGISGPALKPINLKMVYDVYAALGCPIVAYGGIATWEDAAEYLLAGARVIGLGTFFAHRKTADIVRDTAALWSGIREYLNGEPLEAVVGAAHGAPLKPAGKRL
ncbi:MAG: tRNA-dihydrouridine synthase [Candidatus Tectomicrobia bacterium]|nr:tRNA-dihydrouridine synthase [Candidatus Tectomicrobia bacterium]